MTPFAQLGSGHEKSAMPLLRAAGGGLVNLARKGVWGRVGMSADKALAAGSKSKALKGLSGTSKFMRGYGGKALGGYGIAGMVAPALGGSLPGSGLAMTAVSPVLSAMYSAPGLITSGRMLNPEHQKNLKGEVEYGSQQATNHFLTALHSDPSIAYKPGAYGSFMGANGVDLSGTKAYRQGSSAPAPMSRWDQLGAMFTDPQRLINHQVDRGIHRELAKTANIGRIGNTIWNGARNLVRRPGPAATPVAHGPMTAGMRNVGPRPTSTQLAMPSQASRARPRFSGPTVDAKAARPSMLRGALGTAGAFAFPALGMTAIGSAATNNTPYDPLQAQDKGYMAAQGVIQDKLQGMSMFERLAARIDPSVVAYKMEQSRPGTIAQWEQATGQKYKAGWLADTMSAWDGKNTPSYYTHDAAGKRHYVS